jgi:IPT/TIG domain
MTALVAMLASALAGAAAPSAHAAKRKKPKAPKITSVSPLDVAVGETLTVRGRHFRVGREKNTVVFKRDGARAVFAKASVATKRMLQVTVPDSVQEFFALNSGEPVPTRFRLRVLAKRFGKKFTGDGLSPLVSAPRPPRSVTPPVARPDGDCDGDGIENRDDADDDNDGLTDVVEISLSLNTCAADTDDDGVLDKWEFDCDRNGILNRDETDDDKDLLSDTVETSIGTDPCKLDTDGDGVEDGYEYQSAKDLNDDEYQNPNAILPYPYRTPYPNPLYKDAGLDYDGDSLPMSAEYALWKYTYGVNHTATRTLSPLSYSDGMQYSLSHYVSGSDHRRVPSQSFATYGMQANFLAWASSAGYRNVRLKTAATFDAPVGSVDGVYEIRDVNLDGVVDASETNPADYDGNGYVGDDERDEDADGLSNYVEVNGPMHADFWTNCYQMESPYTIQYAATSAVDADTDGDGVRDGADDQDHDDVPNLMEMSRMAAEGYVYDDREGGRDCKVDKDLLIPQDLDHDGEADAQVLNHPAAYGRVNPFNPCLPFTDARTCPSHLSLDSAFAPFDTSVDWVALQ